MGDLPHKVPNDPRYFTADVHVTPDGKARIGGHDYTPAEYADMLRRAGYDGSKPVRLIGCDAGSNDFAQQLSKHLDAPVLAPTKPAWTDANGRVFTSDPEIRPDGTRQPKIPPNGEWETHHPDGSKSKASDDGYAPDTQHHDGTDTDGAKDRGQDDADTTDSDNTKDLEDGHADESPKAPSASDQPVANPKHFPDPPVDPGPAPDARHPDFEQDKARGSLVDEVDPHDTSRVTLKDGLIHTVDGKPVKDYIQDLSRQRAEYHAANKLPGDGPCSAVAMDLKTGKITEGVNGGTTDLIDPENLHPLLRENYKGMGDWQHPIMKNDTDMQQKPVLGENGKAIKDADGKVITEPWVMQGQAHHDEPLRHAEVKAVNELLWARQREFEAEWKAQHGPDSTPPPLSRDALKEMRFDPRWTQDMMQKKVVTAPIGSDAPACANCNTILRDVPSYTGRIQYSPFDHRSKGSFIPPATE
ncbi:YwqJ-related putative deaminase [Lentzea terrae]|uniref:YwqJ-related putative deaminase n=1 Tax=Lentzea terrae TaxID=2200761 RepID=UPI000E6BC7CA|nr:YwqJ-related putative deaminase [Lentzea terrae]